MGRTDLLPLVGLVLAAAGCASSDPMGVEEARIVGRWTWVESFGGIAGMKVTPGSEGVEREIRVGGDGWAELWQDGARVRTTQYVMGLGEAGSSFAGREVVRWEVPLLGGWEEQGVLLPHPDTLLLADGCCDGFTWTFARRGW